MGMLLDVILCLRYDCFVGSVWETEVIEFLNGGGGTLMVYRPSNPNHPTHPLLDTRQKTTTRRISSRVVVFC